MEEYAYKSFLYEQLGGGEKCKNAENALHNFSTHRRAYNKEEEEENDNDENANASEELSTDSDPLQPLPTFPEADWPKILMLIMSYATSPTQRDILLLGALTALGATMERYVRCSYSGKYQSPCLQTFFVAPPASGKSGLSLIRLLVEPIHDKIRQQVDEEMKAYRKEKKNYELLGKERVNTEAPQMPPNKMFLISGNNSGTGILQNIMDANGTGLICETEADTIASAISSEYGHWSDTLRKAFDHDRLSYNRRTDQEYREVKRIFLAVLLSGTPAQVRALIPSAENGLFSRFLFMKVDIPAKWHNVFSKAKRTIDEEMEAIGKRVFRIHQHLVASKSMKPKTGQSYSNDILFELTDAQGEQFNKYFESLVEEYKNMLGRDFVASIYRLGLSTFRIAMVLSIARLEETLSESPTTSISENATTSIICRDEDLDNAITIADTLMQHAAKIFATLMPNKEEDGTLGIKLSPKSERLFENLPDKFNRQTVLSIGKKLGIPQRTAEKYVGEYVNKHGLCKRTGNGEYEKVKQQNADERSLLQMLGKC